MCEVEHVLANKKDFDTKNIHATLSSVLKDNINYKIEESEMDLALGCLEAGIDHLNLRNGTSKQFMLKKYTLGQYLRLDVAALKALNVFP
jgi:DNA mismatch repair ATPase MutS